MLNSVKIRKMFAITKIKKLKSLIRNQNLESKLKEKAMENQQQLLDIDILEKNAHLI